MGDTTGGVAKCHTFAFINCHHWSGERWPTSTWAVAYSLSPLKQRQTFCRSWSGGRPCATTQLLSPTLHVLTDREKQQEPFKSWFLFHFISFKLGTLLKPTISTATWLVRTGKDTYWGLIKKAQENKNGMLEYLMHKVWLLMELFKLHFDDLNQIKFVSDGFKVQIHLSKCYLTKFQMIWTVFVPAQITVLSRKSKEMVVQPNAHQFWEVDC